MPFSEFKLNDIINDFGIEIIDNQDVFASIQPATITQELKNKLKESVPLAQSINTEKARSEFIIAFILFELKSKFKDRISLFSGIDFDVDKEKNLNGFCDFIISLSPRQLVLTSPIITVVEAKNENIIGGLGQCLAEMLAAQLFNGKNKNNIHIIYGVVTTGSSWKFLKLKDNMALVDKTEYHVENIEKIMGILTEMINQTA